MKKLPLIDCQNLRFFSKLSENRINQAQQFLGETVVQRVLCFALYLLGINRKAIAQLLSIPAETAKSIIKVVNRDNPIISCQVKKEKSFKIFKLIKGLKF